MNYEDQDFTIDSTLSSAATPITSSTNIDNQTTIQQTRSLNTTNDKTTTTEFIQTTTNKSGNSLDTGAIIGIVIGVLAAVFIGLAYYCYKYNKKRKTNKISISETKNEFETTKTSKV